MDVASFLKSAPPPVAPDPSQSSDTEEGRNVVPLTDDSAEERNVLSDTTPNGIVVEYESTPKRLYRVNGTEVPSVTTVLDIIHKPALTWYGQRMGVQGVIDLFDMGVLTSAFDWDLDKERLVINAQQGETLGGYADEPSIVAALTEHRLTVNHRRDQAADRGTNVHDALEQWGNTGTVPNPDDFPETERGYVQALVGFLKDVQPTAVRQEVMVGSPTFGFAGRFDLDIELKSRKEFTARCYPKRADKRDTLGAGLYRIDAKTSKGTYPSHHLQLAAYELACVECGYPASDGRFVLRLDATGKYEFVRSNGTPEQFLAVKGAYDALKDLR